MGLKRAVWALNKDAWPKQGCIGLIQGCTGIIQGCMGLNRAAYCRPKQGCMGLNRDAWALYTTVYRAARA